MNHPQWSVQTIHEYPIFFIDGKPLHSTRNPTREFTLFKHLFDLEKYNLYILMGVGCGYILEIFQQRDIQVIILFQDPQELAIYQSLIPTVTNHIQTFLIEDVRWKGQCSRFEPHKIGVWVNPTYYKLLSRYDRIRQHIDHVFTYIKQNLMNRITDAAFGKRWWRNMLRNYIFHPIQPLELPLEITDTPILLIGSGYTTFEQIHWIKAHQDCFRIFAVLPILDLLLAHKIMPDVVVMTDGGSANRYYTSVRHLHPSTTLICYPHVYPLILEWFSGQPLMINSGLEFEPLLMPEMPLLYSGGSVASTMLDLAKCYSYHLYHIGFDFAYTHYHPHYPGSPLESRWLFEAHRFIPAESQFAQRVYTQTQMVGHQYSTSVLMAYRNFFECQVEHLSTDYQIKVLNPADIVNLKLCTSKTMQIFGKEVLDEPIRRDRLGTLLSMLDADIRNQYFHNPLWELITSQAKLKHQPLESVMKKEAMWIHSLLNSGCFSSQS